MLGAIIGDVVGSKYEFNNIRTKDFPLLTKENSYTDDTIMTLAVFEIIENRIYDQEKVIDVLKKWGRAYPNSGYGNRFHRWLFSQDRYSYSSYGNGAAMRISPVGWYARSENEVRRLSRLVTGVTHSHKEGMKAAEVVAMCVYYAKIGKSKEFIKKYVERYYSLDFNYEDLRRNYTFSETCMDSVPQAIYCFLISKDFEDCLRTTISIGGDCDTTAAISCAIAEAYYKEIDMELLEEVISNYLPNRKDGLDPYSMIERFIEYKKTELVTCEEIDDSTKVVLSEIIDEERRLKIIDCYYSKNLSVLKEFLIGYGLDCLLHSDEQLYTINYVDTLALIKFNDPSVLDGINIEEVINDTLKSNNKEAILKVIDSVNEIVKDTNQKFIFFESAKEAYDYITHQSNVNKVYEKTFTETQWIKML